MIVEAPVAIVSGGSSGIGLAVARRLLTLGHRVILLARDPDRLEAARLALDPSENGSVTVDPVDVTDAEACRATIEAVLLRWRRIDWLVTSAGQVEPALFLEADEAEFERLMAVNYFGTLNLVRPVARHMATRGEGRITLVSSAAAFAGVAGYAAYGASKFAVRGLAETLHVELAPLGISVGLAMPPDTDTPQLAGEALKRPEATRRISAGGGVLSADQVAEAIISGALAGRFLLAPGWLMALYGWFHSLYAPFFRRNQISVLRQIARERQTFERNRLDG